MTLKRRCGAETAVDEHDGHSPAPVPTRKLRPVARDDREDSYQEGHIDVLRTPQSAKPKSKGAADSNDRSISKAERDVTGEDLVRRTSNTEDSVDERMATSNELLSINGPSIGLDPVNWKSVIWR